MMGLLPNKKRSNGWPRSIWPVFLPIALSLPLQGNAADTINLVLDNVRLNELAKIAFSDMLNQSYVADDTFNRDEKTVTVRQLNQTKAQINDTVSRLLSDSGYQVSRVGTSIFINSKPEKPDEIAKSIFYYQPKYRNSSYLIGILQSIFKTGRFTIQRNVAAASGEQGGSNPSANGGSDTGTSAYSQISQNYDQILFNGPDKEIEQLQKLLNQVDTPTGEIMVKAYIYEVTDTKGDQTAFSAAISLLNAKLSINTGLAPLRDSVSFKSAGIEAVFTALSTDTRFKVVSAPSLRVKDRETARFSVGAEVPILGATTYQATGPAIQSVTYKNSGIILDISPTIRQGNIELAIKQEMSNFITTTTGVNNSPTLVKRELSSVVNSENDDVIVMGGLEETTTNSDRSGQRWLPTWLHSKSNNGSKSDILLILHVTRL